MARRSSVISVLITGDAKGLTKTLDDTGGRLSSWGAGAAVAIGAAAAAVSGLAATAIRSAVDFESAFTGVVKTVNGTDAEIAALRQGIRDMAKELPASAAEISNVASAAGQLGIRTENILGFTRVMIDLGESTNLSAEQAATAFARLANIMGTPQDKFSNLGSTVAALGNNLATTEAEIVDLALNLSAAGSQVGMSEDQVLAFAGALSSVGLEAAAGGSSLSRVFLEINSAVLSGSGDLQKFARIAGMSSGDFAKAFRDDAASAIVSFVSGLQSIQKSGGDVAGALAEVGFSELRVRDALGRAAGAGDLLTTSLNIASTAFSENTALAREAELRYGTTAAQIDIFKNRLNDVAITIGTALLPIVGQILDALTPFIERLGAAAPKLEELIAAARTKGAEFKAAFDEKFRQPLIDFRDAIVDAVDRMREKLDEVKTKGKEFVDSITGPFRDADAGDSARAFGESIGSALLAGLDELQNITEPLMEKFRTWVASIDWFRLGIDATNYVIQFGVGLVAGFFAFDWVFGLLEGMAANWEIVLSAVLGIMFAPAKWAGKLAQFLGRIPLLGRLLSWATTSLNSLGGSIASGFSNWVWQPFSQAVGRVLGTAGPGLMARFATMLRGIPAAFRTALDDALLRVATFFDDLGTRVGGAMLPLRQAWTRLLDDAALTIRNFFWTLREIGGNMVRGLWEGIKSMGSWLINQFRNFIDDAINGVKRLLGIRSPSIVFAEMGVNIGQGLAEGIASTDRLVAAAMTGLSGVATGSFSVEQPTFAGSRVGAAGGQTTVNVTVTSADPQAVVEAIRRYTRGNGPLGQVVNL